MDTIFALASAQGRAGVSIVRLSGPKAQNVARSLAGELPPDRIAGLRVLKNQRDEDLDQAVVLRFDAPRSFTGEDVVELHLHGSIAVVKSVLQVLGDHPDARLAEPGEFTRRALENGQMDLAQVEGLADLIEAETESQRRQALRVVQGELGALVAKWRSQLIRSAALLEATIDFADEDVPLDVTPEVRDLLQSVDQEVKSEILGSVTAERIRSGFEVAIVGPPNAGKSTLLNALAGRDAAIISDIAGTTRDVIEVRMDLGGIPVTILDTAGLRESTDVIEKIGIERAIDRAKAADIRIFLVDSSEELMLKPEKDDIVTSGKADLTGSGISGLTGQGVSELLQKIQATLEGRASSAGLATHERHREALQKASAALDLIWPLLDSGPDFYDLVAAELHSAIHGLETLVGLIDVENLLDEIFSSFCLGK